MKAGTTVYHRLHFTGLDFALVESMIITYSARYDAAPVFTRRYPEDIVWMDGVPCIPLTQEDTLTLREAIAPDSTAAVTGQINYTGGSVGSTGTVYIRVCPTLATELVDENAPDPALEDVDITFYIEDSTTDAGTTVFHRLHFPGLDFNLVETMIITYSARKNNGIIMQRRFPEDIVWLDGVPCIPMTQENTLKIWEAISPDHMAAVETQINFTGGAVGKTNIAYIRICPTVATEPIPGNAPDPATAGIDIRFLTDDVVVVAGGGGGGILPDVTQADNGKVLTVVNGQWAAKELPVYQGEYSVKPQFGHETVLETAGTYMTDSVAVKPIGIEYVSNPSGGKTVIIGA